MDLLSRLAISKTQFFGKEVSPVDYLIAFSAKKDQFLVVDEAEMKVKRVKSPFIKYKLLIMDSRVPRMGFEDELKQRLREPERADSCFVGPRPEWAGARCCVADDRPHSGPSIL